MASIGVIGRLGFVTLILAFGIFCTGCTAFSLSSEEEIRAFMEAGPDLPELDLSTSHPVDIPTGPYKLAPNDVLAIMLPRPVWDDSGSDLVGGFRGPRAPYFAVL